MPEEGFKRMPNAIICTDAVGDSCPLAEVEPNTVKIQSAYRAIIMLLFNQHRDRVYNPHEDCWVPTYAGGVDHHVRSFAHLKI